MSEALEIVDSPLSATMSAPLKRDASDAFEDATDRTQHGSKKRQRRRTRKSLPAQEENATQTTPLPTPATPLKTDQNDDATEKTELIESNEVHASESRPVSNGSREQLTKEQRDEKLSQSINDRRFALKKIKEERSQKDKPSTSAEDQEARKKETGKVLAGGRNQKKTPQMSKPALPQHPSNSTPQVQSSELSKREISFVNRQKKQNNSSLVGKSPKKRQGEQHVEPEESKPLSQQEKVQKLGKPAKTPKAIFDAGWITGPVNGGMFIDQDPVLTEDDQYLILPTHAEIRVYATATSLLVRSFQVDSKSDITSCAISRVDPAKLYVSCSKGLVSLWNWTTGAKICNTKAGLRVRQVLPLQSHEQHEAVLLLTDEDDESRSLVVYSINMSERKFTRGETIFHGSIMSPCVQSFCQGSILVACAENQLLVGQSKLTAEGHLELPYVWRDMSVSGYITCFDAQVKPGKSKTSRNAPVLDIAVGLGDGVIVQYQDLLFKLKSNEKKGNSNAMEIQTRKRHWHKKAVNTVKWSRDQNYTISGGNESVLVIWQLDSLSTQFLPHLSAPILNLTVSASGSSYALRMGDNSVMILPTADLIPSTNINGLALGQTLHDSSLVTLDPSTSGRLLAAVPVDGAAAGPFHGKIPIFLQVYDFESNFQIARQALTRNLVTAPDVGPTGQRLREPKVTHIDISHDGKWLATVDEWQPNDEDLAHVFVEDDSQELRGIATETSVRLWSWNEEAQIFEQVTRIDNPHEPGPKSVLGLAFSPSKLEFATIGTDANVHIWAAKARHRNGMPVRNRANEQLYTWKQSATANGDYDNLSAETPSRAKSAGLAYSDDGSIIAASWSWFDSATQSSDSPGSGARIVNLVNTATGEIVSACSGLIPSTTEHARLLFHSRYLICLSSKLKIYDTTTYKTVRAPFIPNHRFLPPESSAPSLLARNRFDGTIAIAVSQSEWPRGSKVAVIDFENQVVNEEDKNAARVIYEGSFLGNIKGLLALKTGPGYLLIDERNQTRLIQPPHTSGAGATLAVADSMPETGQEIKSLESVFGQRGSPELGTADSNGESATAQGLIPGRSDEEQVTQNTSVEHDLEAAVRSVSTADTPSVQEMFQRVLRVMGRAAGM